MNQRVLDRVDTGVRKVASKAPTVPQTFQLSCDKAVKKDTHHTHDQEEHYEFHARPVNTKMLAGPLVRGSLILQ